MSPKTPTSPSGSIDFNALVDGSRQLKLSQETNWKWQQDSRSVDQVKAVSYNTKHFS